ncbi:hypothetical protein [Anaerosporobacter sp.]|uniref:hypothetical protein n=1 Tax=Anaerosporobacter sp. TaxID=1872529 RepID=UPI00286F9201|nr:hypothetical protein [Anaerosporobacter sp.]
MKIISDIRLYKSDIDNINGNSLPSGFSDRSLNLTVRRIAMKLREYSFSLGEFDHLYLNFTNCLPDGTIEPAKRTVDRYSPWYRYYDIGVSQDVFVHLGSENTVPKMLELIKQTLIQYFVLDENDKKVIDTAINAVVTNGSKTLMRFKEKKAAKTTAVIYLQLLDTAGYLPIISVCDLQGKELLRENLPETFDLSSIGEIQLSSKKITVKPRKNAFAQNLEPISFSFNL